MATPNRARRSPGAVLSDQSRGEPGLRGGALGLQPAETAARTSRIGAAIARIPKPVGTNCSTLGNNRLRAASVEADSKLATRSGAALPSARGYCAGTLIAQSVAIGAGSDCVPGHGRHGSRQRSWQHLRERVHVESLRMPPLANGASACHALAARRHIISRSPPRHGITGTRAATLGTRPGSAPGDKAIPVVSGC